MKKSKERPSVTKALMWRITALALGLWLVAMCYLTVIVAQDQYERYIEDFERSMRYRGDDSYWYMYDGEIEEYTRMLNYSNIIAYVMRGVYTHSPELSRPFSEDYLILGWSDSWWEYFNTTVASSEDWAMVVLDSSDQVILGQDGYANLTYYNEDVWFGLTEEHDNDLTSINLNRGDYGLLLSSESFRYNWYFEPCEYRLTGYFDEDEFVPVDISYINLSEVRNTMHDYDPYLNMDIGEYDHMIGLDWVTEYDGEAPSDQELVNIYLDNIYVDQADSVDIHGKTWKLEELAEAYSQDENVRGLLSFYGTESNSIEMLENYPDESVQTILGSYSKDSLWETVIIQAKQYIDENNDSCNYVMVFRCQPIKVAMLLLVEVYVITLLALVLPLLLIRRRIREDLIHPMKHVMKYAAKDYAVLPDTVESDWLEIYELEQGYVKAQKDIHEYRKQINQLNTALDYAHNAEENRRLMVSNITHELKTPLAVIHSYAEGLKEGIAADKQEHYLDVILEETQRMDGMVLEMLDLSRLEAGKVRLASDRFSLLELTRSVVDKLSLLVEEKALMVKYVWAHDCDITADEGRICQAVTNLVSNAIKYSPREATVYISVTRVKDKTMFSIENQSEPLSEEALSNIWDSFYQADASHATKGTGLGLPITKAIIELHGGSCHVQNTATGVEFRFELP